MYHNHLKLAQHFKDFKVEESEHDLIAHARQIEQSYFYYHKARLKGKFCVDERSKLKMMRYFILTLMVAIICFITLLTTLIAKDVIHLDQLQRNASLVLLPLAAIFVILSYACLCKTSKDLYLSLFQQMNDAQLIPTTTLTDSLIESSDELLAFCVDPYTHVLELIDAHLGEVQATVEQWRGTQLENKVISLANEVESSLKAYRAKFKTYEKIYQTSMDTEMIRRIDHKAKQSYDELKACIEDYWFKRAQLITNCI